MIFSRYVTGFVFLFVSLTALCQGRISWMKDGSSYTRVEAGEIVKYSLPANTKSVIVGKTN